MNEEERAIIINRLEVAKADYEYYRSWEKATFETYCALRVLARDLGIEP